MRFTLVEDILVLERLVIPRVRNEKLSNIVLIRQHCTDLTRHLDKSPTAIMLRWISVLQPWLLQHYSGTLNLRVEMMLANYILDTFTDFSTIEWPEVAKRSEFAGHTENSLRMMYMNTMCKGAKRKFGINGDEVTPQRIVEYCESVRIYGEGGDERSSKMKGQRDVISYSERKVMELDLKDFV